MSATYVTPTELRSALGIGSLYDDTTLELVCQTSQDIISKQLWRNTYPVVGAGLYNNYAYLSLATAGAFVAGQTITISGCGVLYDGTHTITSTYPWTPNSGSFPYFTFYPFNTLNYPRGFSLIQFALTHADDNYHLITPYGKIAGQEYGDAADYSLVPAVREASLMVAIDIWQARQQSNAGGISPDFTPSPYRMGNTLLARVRGLLAPYLSPRGMVG